MSLVNIEKLTAKQFEKFGEVIEKKGDYQLINWDYTKKYPEQIEIDLMPKQSKVGVHIFNAGPYPMPIKITMLERHPFGSQAFIPMCETPFLIAVAEELEQPKLEQIRFFITDGFQGVNYKRNIWHHPLLALKKQRNFVVIDRADPTDNLEEFFFDQTIEITKNQLTELL